MKINVIGLGYIGLPTALMMASKGLEIIGTDYNKELVDKRTDVILNIIWERVSKWVF